MVKGIHLDFKKDSIVIKEIKPVRTKDLVIFSNKGELLLWEPNEIKATKTDMKKYVLDVAQLISNKIGPTTVLAHGLFKYEWLGGKEFEVNLGGVVIGKVIYKDSDYEIVDTLEYRPRFADLINIKNFI